MRRSEKAVALTEILLRRFRAYQNLGLGGFRSHAPAFSQQRCIDAERGYGIGLAEALPQGPFDLVLLAVPHQTYLDLGDEALRGLVAEGGMLADLKGVLNGRADWSL